MKVNLETGQNELFREVQMNGEMFMDLFVEMPGEYIIESSTNGVSNKDATLCFDEEWVQTCSKGKAKIRDRIVRTTFQGSVVPRSSNEVLYEADMLLLKQKAPRGLFYFRLFKLHLFLSFTCRQACLTGSRCSIPLWQISFPCLVKCRLPGDVI